MHPDCSSPSPSKATENARCSARVIWSYAPALGSLSGTSKTIKSSGIDFVIPNPLFSANIRDVRSGDGDRESRSSFEYLNPSSDIHRWTSSSRSATKCLSYFSKSFGVTSPTSIAEKICLYISSGGRPPLPPVQAGPRKIPTTSDPHATDDRTLGNCRFIKCGRRCSNSEERRWRSFVARLLDDDDHVAVTAESLFAILSLYDVSSQSLTDAPPFTARVGPENHFPELPTLQYAVVLIRAVVVPEIHSAVDVFALRLYAMVKTSAGSAAT